MICVRFDFMILKTIMIQAKERHFFASFVYKASRPNTFLHALSMRALWARWCGLRPSASCPLNLVQGDSHPNCASHVKPVRNAELAGFRAQSTSDAYNF